MNQKLGEFETNAELLKNVSSLVGIIFKVLTYSQWRVFPPCDRCLAGVWLTDGMHCTHHSCIGNHIFWVLHIPEELGL